jgi:hypothetical protein
MKFIQMAFVKQIDVIVAVPEGMGAADLERIAEGIDSFELDHDWESGDWEVDFCHPCGKDLDESQVDIALSDDGKELVHPADAGWWMNRDETEWRRCDCRAVASGDGTCEACGHPPFPVPTAANQLELTFTDQGGNNGQQPA